MKIWYQAALYLVFISVQSCSDKGHTGQVSIENDLLSVGISTLGAELNSVRLKESGTEYLWQADPQYWDASAPVMFPVNVRFKDDRFTYKGKQYEMPTLGVAVNSIFEVSHEKPHRVVFSLESNENTLRHYPFPFRLDIAFVLEENRLIQEFTVANTGEETMYFALGGHPGFRIPLRGGRTREDYCLSFPEALDIERQEVSGGLVQPSRVSYLENEKRLIIGDPGVPNSGMLLLDLPVRRIGIGLLGAQPNISVDLGDFPNVNIWSPPGKPYVCIEPMVGHHDLQDSPLAIEEKTYLKALPAGASRVYRFSIIVHEKVDAGHLAD